MYSVLLWHRSQLSWSSLLAPGITKFIEIGYVLLTEYLLPQKAVQRSSSFSKITHIFITSASSPSHSHSIAYSRY